MDENGSVTAASFTGDGSRLTNIATAVNGTSITPSTISTGSTTVSTLTVSGVGSATVGGTLTVAGGAFIADSGSTTVSTRLGVGTTTSSANYLLQVTNDGNLGFVVASSGSVTANTLSATGSATVTGTLTAGNSNFQVDDSISRAIIDFDTVGIGTETPSSNYILQVTNDGSLGFVVAANGSLTAANGNFVVGANGSVTAAYLDIGNGTITVGSSNQFIVDENGLVTAVGTITAGSFSTTGTITTSNIYSAGTITLTTHNAGGIALGSNHQGATGTMTITGNLFVAGGFDATSKAFLIPHPDPSKDGWMLKHSCVEGPTRGDTQYRYTVEVKTNGGEASIALPQYWKYLNENPQVWVTAVGQFSNGYGYVDGTSGKLIIKGEKKGVYNVLLMGTRKDQYAKKFDETGVEYVDEERYRMLTGGVKPEAHDPQFINTRSAMGERKDGLGELQLIELSHSGGTTKQYMDPLWAEWDIEGVK